MRKYFSFKIIAYIIILFASMRLMSKPNNNEIIVKSEMFYYLSVIKRKMYEFLNIGKKVNNVSFGSKKIPGLVGTYPIMIDQIITKIKQIPTQEKRYKLLVEPLEKLKIQYQLPFIVEKTAGMSYRSIETLLQEIENAQKMKIAFHAQYKSKVADNYDPFSITLEEIEEFVKNIPKEPLLQKVLLYGPPGTGKTTLARMIAQSVDARFMGDLRGPNIVGKYINEGAEKIEKLFEEAYNHYKSTGQLVLIFFDEIDAIANKTSSEVPAGHDYVVATQSLWLQLDLYKDEPGIIFVCATNHLDVLNPTFVNRFGTNVIEIGNPDAVTRREVLQLYLKSNNILLDEKILNNLVKHTQGLGIRSLEYLVVGILNTAQANNMQVIDEYVVWDTLDAIKSTVNATSSKNPFLESRLNKMHTITSLTLNLYHIGSIINQWHMTNRDWFINWFGLK